MNIAYLVLCHKNPKQVTSLINSLSNDNVDFYIHVDKKARDFYITENSNIFILPDEHCQSVKWGTVSMIHATLNAIQYMLEQNKKYDYVCLLSGQDFPIKSKEYINDYLSANRGCNFIEIFAHSDAKYTRYYKRTSIFYYEWMLKNNIFARVIKRIYIAVTGGYNHTFRIFKRKNTTTLDFEYGSQWWCLTFDCVKWMFDYVQANKNILQFFNNAIVPDECFFQTIFMASPFKETHRDKLTYLEWSSDNKHPRILTMDDYDTLINNKCDLFARKFDIQTDYKIIEKLLEI